MIDKADLWLLRHGVAADKALDRTDQEDFVRPLTKKGVRQSVNAGKLLERLANVDRIRTSPRVRCVQTAVLAGQELGVKPKRNPDLDGLHPRKALDHVKDGKTTLLVGHVDLDDTIEHLTGRAVHLSRGALACLKIRNGQASLDKLLSPADIAGML